MAAAVVHKLRVDMARGPKNVQTRRLSATASPLADSLMNPAARQIFGEQFQHVRYSSMVRCQWSVVSGPLSFVSFVRCHLPFVHGQRQQLATLRKTTTDY